MVPRIFFILISVELLVRGITAIDQVNATGAVSRSSGSQVNREAHVCGDAGGFQAISFETAGNFIDGFLLTATDDDSGPEFGQASCHGLTDTFARTGNQGKLAIELEQWIQAVFPVIPGLVQGK
jgi:hypothetical protein